MPLFWLSLAFITGITLAHIVSLPVWVWACLCGIALLTALLRRLGYFGQLLHQIRSPISISFLLLALSLGALRYQLSLPNLQDPTFIASYAGRGEQVTLEGVLVEPPDVRDQYSLLRLQSERIQSASAAQATPVHGLALVRVYTPGEWRYGDRLRIFGVLSVPQEGESFSYRDYLARQGIYAYMSNAEVAVLQAGQGNWFFQKMYAFKARGLKTLNQLYPEPEASLLAGILFGVESGIPQAVRQAFNDTGTAHIIVISGFNITILAGLFSTMFGRLLGRWRGALVALLGIAVYTLLVGADAAVMRAAIMGGLSLYAVQFGRRQHGLNSLALVAAVMACFHPLTLWDVGFQLSFAATLGLVLYAKPFTGWVVDLISRRVDPTLAQRLGGLLAEYLLFTIAAQLTTLPIILYYFQRLSWISFLANPLILPAQPLVMVLGGLSVLAGLIWLPLGQALGSLAWPFAAYTIRVVELFDRLQGRAIVLDRVPVWLVFGYFVILFAITLANTRERRWLPVVRPGVVLLVLGAMTLGVWQAALRLPDGRLHLTLLNTSAGSASGEALLIQTPGGRYVLVNGGPSPTRLSDALGRRLPIHSRQLDWAIVAGGKDSQIDALPLALERYLPRHVLWAGAENPTSSGRYLRQKLAEWGVPVIQAQPGHTLELGEGVYLRVLSCGEWGATLLLEWGDFRALLPCGLDYDALQDLQQDPSITPVSVLLLADRGRDWLNPPEWIDKLNPQMVLLNVAAGDWDGFPTPQTLEALQGYILLRTDQNGWIEVMTDGHNLWVEVERKSIPALR